MDSQAIDRRWDKVDLVSLHLLDLFEQLILRRVEHRLELIAFLHCWFVDVLHCLTQVEVSRQRNQILAFFKFLHFRVAKLRLRNVVLLIFVHFMNFVKLSLLELRDLF